MGSYEGQGCSTMVRTRKPKAAAKSDDVYQSTDELPDDLKARYEALLEDYDRQIEKKMEEMANQMTAMGEKFYTDTIVSVMKLSTSVRKQNWEDQLQFLVLDDNCEKNFAVETAKKAEQAEEQIRQLKEQIAADVQSAIKEDKAKSTAKKRKATTTRGLAEASVIEAPSTGLRKSARSRTTSKVPFTPGGKANQMDESVLTSTANTTRTRGRRVLQTPGNISMVAPPAAAQSMHPFITPKVDLRTPMPVSVMRNAKPNEIAFSMNGSPIMPGATTVRKGAKGRKAAPAPDAIVAIGGNKELQLNLGDDALPNFQLDAEAKAKIEAVRNQLKRLLDN